MKNQPWVPSRRDITDLQKNKCHELNWSGERGRKDPHQKRQQNAMQIEKMLSTTKTYPCAKTTVVLMCKRKKNTHTSTLSEKDAVIPLRMSWVRSPTGGDTHWSKLVLHKLCIPSLRLPWNSYFTLPADKNRRYQTDTCALKRFLTRT